MHRPTFEALLASRAQLMGAPQGSSTAFTFCLRFVVHGLFSQQTEFVFRHHKYSVYVSSKSCRSWGSLTAAFCQPGRPSVNGGGPSVCLGELWWVSACVTACVHLGDTSLGFSGSREWVLLLLSSCGTREGPSTVTRSGKILPTNIKTLRKLRYLQGSLGSSKVVRNLHDSPRLQPICSLAAATALPTMLIYQTQVRILPVISSLYCYTKFCETLNQRTVKQLHCRNLNTWAI